MALAQKGIDVRQTGTGLLFDGFLQDSLGALVTSGTTTLRLYEVQSDGTLKSYDFNDNTFKTTALGTATLSMSHRQGNNATANTGYWSATLATLTGFTAGGIYLANVNNTGALPTDQMRKFQYGSEQGDLVVTANGTGVGELNADLKMLDGSATAATNQAAAATVVYKGTITGASPTTTTLVDSGLTQADNNFWNGRVVIFLTGSLKYQATPLSAFTAASDQLTFTALTSAPAQNDTYVIV